MSCRARTGFRRSVPRHASPLCNKATYVAVPGPVGGRDLGARADARRRRPRARHRPRRDPAAATSSGRDELPRNDDHRADARRPHVGRPRRSRRPCEIADLDDWAARQSGARAEGRLPRHRASPPSSRPRPGPPDFQESIMPGAAPRCWRRAGPRRRSRPTAPSRVFTQQMPHGQGHETTLAQVAADELGVPIEHVRVALRRHPITPFGLSGTGGSRAAHDGQRRGHRTASRELRGAGARRRRRPARGERRDDLEIDDGAIHVAGAPASHLAGRDRRTSAGRRRSRRTPSARRLRARSTAARAAGRRRTHVLLGRGRPRDRPVQHPPLRRGRGLRRARSTRPSSTARSAAAWRRASAPCSTSSRPTTTTASSRPGTFMDYLLPTAMEIPDDRDPPRRDAAPTATSTTAASARAG